jgi:hypothetical protein
MRPAKAWTFRIAVAGVFSLLLAPASWADGDDFFQVTDTPLESQLVFVGTVKDQAGTYLNGALVTWHAISVDESGEQSSSSGTFTDRMGRFRTVDVARIVAINGYDLDPTRVEVSVTKPGYVMVRRLKRTRERQRMGLLEIDFVMAKAKPGDSIP